MDEIFQNILPDNRPIKSVKIVEDASRCPKNFHAIQKTYDQDQDADLWREMNIIFGIKTKRYLCISKNEGLDDHVLNSLKIIGEKDPVPEGYTSLKHTADTEQKAWRKKQLVYKLTKQSETVSAITDIILCSKYKRTETFIRAGEINGIVVCYKTVPLSSFSPSAAMPMPVSVPLTPYNNIGKQIENLKLQASKETVGNLQGSINHENHDYELLRKSYQITPNRPAPKPPAASTTNASNYGTLNSQYSELDGVPFILNPKIITDTYEPPTFNCSITASQIEYDFQLERQFLCTTKSSNNTNPFFQ